MVDNLVNGGNPTKKRSSSESVKIRVLIYLANNSGEDAVGFTQHHLMNIKGLPEQNWSRFKTILDQLVRAGLLEKNTSSGFALFRISAKGEELVDRDLHRLDRSY